MMSMKLNVSYKLSYLISILACTSIFTYFAYKGIIAYLIHKELYGGGIDVVISLRGIISAIMVFFIILQCQFLRIKDLKSHKTILTGILIVWTAIFITCLLISRKDIYFLMITFLPVSVTLFCLLKIDNQIKEERNNLTEKEIYLLQQLAKKK